MANRLRLSRSQIASIVGNDPEAIKQFETLFAIGNMANDAVGGDDTASAAMALGHSAMREVTSVRSDADASNAITDIKANKALQALGAIQDAVDAISNPFFIFVSAKSDLPAPASGVITLEDEYTYYFTTEIDLTGDRLVAGRNTTILGASSENCRIKSTGLTGTALLSSEWTLPMRNITLEADIALDLDATGNADQAIDWYGVNFTDCGTVGTVTNYGNFIFSVGAFLNSGALTFDGTTGTIGITESIFNVSSGGSGLVIPSTATITRRLRITYSALIVLSGETGLDVSAGATVPDEGYILDTVNFAGGGTYTAGVTYDDNKALWSNCRGVRNSATIGFMTMLGNATATTVSASGTYYKVAGTTTEEAVTERFSHASNRLTYDGALTRDFKVVASGSATSGNNQELGVRIALNGTTLTNSTGVSTTSGSGKAEGLYAQTVLELVPTDYLEVFVSNETSTSNITVPNLSVVVEALN